MFGGYRKHQAELRWSRPGPVELAVRALAPLWRALPRSRNSPIQDKVRQLDRFAELSGMDITERFMHLAAFHDPMASRGLIRDPGPLQGLKDRERMAVNPIAELAGLNGVLLADVCHTLPNDMLHKVDLTSMAHGLEVRPPFLDHRVVEFAFGLPAERKLRKGPGKHILRETFGYLLPTEVMARTKKGFEVPLLRLLIGPVSGLVDELTAGDLVHEAGLDPHKVNAAVSKMRSDAPGTSQATVHALLVYLSWWRSQLGKRNARV